MSMTVGKISFHYHDILFVQKVKESCLRLPKVIMIFPSKAKIYLKQSQEACYFYSNFQTFQLQVFVCFYNEKWL